MTNIVGSIMISGMVLINGRGSDDQVVLVLSNDMTRLIASTTTGADGRYAIEMNTNGKNTSVVLVLKIQKPILALKFRRIEIRRDIPQQDFNVDTTSDEFCTLQGDIVTNQNELPPYVEISINPTHLNGIPSEIEKFFFRRSEKVVDADYYETRITDHHFELRLQRGIYRISGAHIVYKNEGMILPKTTSFVVDKIFADNEKIPLSGEKLGGFTLNVESNRKIKMHLEILSDKTINPVNH
jgi:hypothetical protein